MTQCLPVKENENIQPSVTRAGRSVPKDSDGWNKGKSREEPAQLRPGCGRCPIGCRVGKRKDGEAFRSFGAWSYLGKHPSTPLLTPDLLEKCFCNW